jgi:hypothetical protein
MSAAETVDSGTGFELPDGRWAYDQPSERRYGPPEPGDERASTAEAVRDACEAAEEQRVDDERAESGQETGQEQADDDCAGM